MFMCIAASPDFNTYPQDADPNIGDSIMLSCSASGDPSPQIVWEKTDQRTGVRMVLSGSDIVALSNGDLPLVNVQQNDSGLYHCIADNQVDQIEATAIIRVQGLYAPTTCIGHICICTYVHKLVPHTNMYIHALRHIIHTHTYTLHMYTHAHIYRHTCTHMYTHICTYMHSHMHIHTLTFTSIHIYPF